MDTITHKLFGLTMYGAIDKGNMEKSLKKSLLLTALAGSQIPDIDVISKLWDTEGLYQMWHRGLTHSVFLVPVWALLLYAICIIFWKRKDSKIFYTGLLAVFIHVTSDLFNAWGTGYLEPFSSIRLTFGTISIIDFTVWTLILLGFFIVNFRKYASHKVYKTVWALIVLHFFLQSAQGYSIYQQMKPQYEQQALSASFIPGHFNVIGKTGDRVEISQATVWGERETGITLTSREEADLNYLFAHNPRAKTLYEWSPFIVVVDDDEQIGIYDPRFFRNGQSFLFESVKKPAFHK